MHHSWQDIVSGCIRKDRAMQKLLYDTYFPYGMSVTMRYCDDRQQALAVLHDAFLKVFRKIGHYDTTLAFEPWFRTIVVRAALDYLRKRSRTTPTVQLNDDLVAYDREEILSRIGYDELLDMVRRLTTGYRVVFNLHVIDGFKHEEIAAQLGISIGTSKSNLHKARAALRRMVEESLSPPTPKPAAP